MAEADRVSSLVTQAGHGFTRGQCIRFDGTNWVLATAGQPGVGLAGSLVDANVFEFVQSGFLDGLDGLIPGTTYYPSPLGELTATANGSAIGVAYTDRVLHVIPAGSAATALDTSAFVTYPVLIATVAAEAVRIDAALAAVAATIPGPTMYLHSIENDAVISVDPANVGVVFNESDGTQVLVE